MIIFIGLVVAIETWKRLSLCSFLYRYQLVLNYLIFQVLLSQMLFNKDRSISRAEQPKGSF